MSDTGEDKTEETPEEQQSAPASSTEEPAEAKSKAEEDKPDEDAAGGKSQADADKESPAEGAAKSSVEDGPTSKAKSGIDDDGPKSKAKSGVEDGPASKAKSGVEDGPKSKAKSGVEDGPASKAKSGVEDGPKSKAKSGVEDGPTSKAKSGVEDGPKSKAAASDEKPKSSVEDGGAKSKAKSGIEEGGAKSKAKSGVEEVGKTKSQAGGAAVGSTKSGIQEGAKNKSQAQAKSGIEATKSGTKSEVKATKSRDSTKRRSSTASTGSQDRKPSRTSSSKLGDLTQARIGFVGAGRMTDSLVKGLLKAGKVKPKQIFVAAKTSKNLDNFKSQGIVTSTRSYDVFGKFDCDLVFLCMHGFVVRNCFKLGGTRPAPFTTNYIPSRKRTTFILSLVGGVPLEDVKLTLLNPEADKHNVEMHRVVMNTSVAYGLGIGALDVEIDSQKCHPLVRDTLQSVANIVVASPDQMDSICTVTGSGLALTYYFISALADGGFKMGLHRPIAVKLATKAMQCAAQCLLETGKSPTELRDSVTSASGPSIYGLNVLDKSDCNSGIQSAVEAAYKRLKELVDVAN